MSPKLNVTDIVAKHFGTLYNNRNGGDSGLAPVDVWTFFLVPLVPAVLVALYASLSPGFLAAVTTLFAIFAGLLFNLLVLTLDHARKLERDIRAEPEHSTGRRTRLSSTQELLYNVSFEVLVSVVAVVLALVMELVPDAWAFRSVLDGLLVWLVGVFVMNLFMVLKRAHMLVVNVLG